MFGKKKTLGKLKKGLKITAPPVEEKPYKVSQTGTFTEDDIRINGKGLVISSVPKKDKDESYIGINGLEELDMCEVLGSGSSGTVRKAINRNTQEVLAVKVIPLDVSEGVRQKLLRELRTLYQCDHSYVVKFKGAFFREGSISIALEYMDTGSLAQILQHVHQIPEPVLGKMAGNILSAIDYIHRDLHIVHRDIKPQNLLVNSKGEVKLSDFGVSGKLENTIGQAITFVGTLTYMSPERIGGDYHSITADIWSLGLSLLECALGYFPYKPPDGQREMTFFELLERIQLQPSPTLPDNGDFSPEFCSFIDACLIKNPAERPGARELLEHPFILKYKDSSFDLEEWIRETLRSMGKLEA